MGVPYGLEKEMDFTRNLTRELQEKRDVLAAGLKRSGFDVLPCEGTYFLTASIRNLTNEPDRVFCERLTREAGITPVPLSAFFGPDGPMHLVRLAFCKKRPVIDEVVKRLEKHFKAQ